MRNNSNDNSEFIKSQQVDDYSDLYSVGQDISCRLFFFNKTSRYKKETNFINFKLNLSSNMIFSYFKNLWKKK